MFPLQDKFHAQLDQADLKDLFHVESHSQVPSYDVIRVHSRRRTRRSAAAGEDEQGGGTTHAVHLKVFGEDKVLNLRPSEGIRSDVPVYFADPRQDGSGVKLTPLHHVSCEREN